MMTTVSLLIVGMTCGAGAQTVTVDAGGASILSGDRLVLKYKATDVPYKPYVETLATPAGINLLRDAPHDHLHHHGLMFAVAVNGATFWSETPEAGKQVHRGGLTSGDENGSPWFSGALDWVGPEGRVLLQEKRRVELTPRDDVTLLTWSTTLKAPESGETVLGGSHYYGLGMRFVESMDKIGTFMFATDAEGERVRGTEKLTPSTWCAYAAEAEGKPVTVAMFDAPGNPRPALWFTMTSGFAYISATINYWKDPVPMKAGSELPFRYGVAMWDGHKAREDIQEVYDEWLKIVAEQS